MWRQLHEKGAARLKEEAPPKVIEHEDTAEQLPVELVASNHPAWRKALLLEQLLHQPSCGFGRTAALDEEIQNIAVVVDGAPEPGALPPDDDHRLVEVPMIAGPGAGAA